MPIKHYGCALPSEPLLFLTTRCLESSCDMMKWLTSSSDQYDRWLARLASSDMSKAPLFDPVSSFHLLRGLMTRTTYS
jgi:hypothetical protein